MRLVRAHLNALGIAMMLIPGIALSANPDTMEKTHTMNIVFDAGDQQIPATLEDSAAGRAFADMLPLTLELEDFGGGVEKIADLPTSLPDETASKGMKPAAGDITYYAPWGNLAIFRKGFKHASGLVRLGQFDADFSAIDRSGPIEVTIKRAE
ncbi:hypothetical protein SAMN05421848_0408 [Kushneria avicenniae]|uniref:Cyclophilin-like domain-containing protein n=1 Tax=Kushneria avicenniae TaxID=402385 RepID=A0A1I1G4H0_9GAMM|nr:cyclophilin-like fold protein [Kushneria avicenniae]SFC06401.1 hypothetical protein SAMN05421848_0408 [Kushneria avicenniae]